MVPRVHPERRRRPGAPRWTELAARLLLIPLAGLAGCLCPPTLEQIEGLGFRSPSQTLRTFQIAVRADAPRLEYSCLSVDFRRRNQISQIGWREYRDEWFAANPFLKRGIAKAEIVSEERIAQDFAVLTAQAYGRRIVIELRREGFYQIHSGEELIADDLLPEQDGLARYVGAAPSSDARLLLQAAIEVRPEELPEELTELRIGLEWKLDGIQVEQDPSSDPHEANP